MSNLMSGAKMLLECLAREGVDIMFGYPGGVTLPFYDSLYDHEIKHILVRHEENACFAAEGYARTTGKVGVCCATSGPGATNLVTGLVDAMMDSIPIVALTGQVTSKLIGSDAFQEADTFGITRSCTKHNYLVKNIQELPGIIHEAFHIASTGRPGPVLVDIPKDVFQAQGHYAPVNSIHLPGYKLVTEGHSGQIRRAAQMIWEAKRPYIYAGGGVIASASHAELKELVEMVEAFFANTGAKFRHGGNRIEDCGKPTAADVDKEPASARHRKSCSRQRLPVAVVISIDGAAIYDDILPPTGFAGDGPAETYRKFLVPAGRHRIEARLRDSDRQQGYDYERSLDVDLAPLQNLAIDFRADQGGFLFR